MVEPQERLLADTVDLDLADELQVKLLRVLQKRRFHGVTLGRADAWPGNFRELELGVRSYPIRKV